MKKIIIASLLALLLTFSGLFIGLQISPVLGGILLFPFVAVAYFSQIGFGHFTLALKLGLLLFTVAFWTWILLLIYKIKSR